MTDGPVMALDHAAVDGPAVTCPICSNLREGRCYRALAAGLWPDKFRPGTAEVGPDLAAATKHCSAFAPRKARP